MKGDIFTEKGLLGVSGVVGVEGAETDVDGEQLGVESVENVENEVFGEVE